MTDKELLDHLAERLAPVCSRCGFDPHEQEGNALTNLGRHLDLHERWDAAKGKPGSPGSGFKRQHQAWPLGWVAVAGSPVTVKAECAS